MVTATDNPKAWRVEIPILHTSRSKSEIVCYLVMGDDGLRVYYSHHMIYDRAVDSGPWGPPKATWHTINPGLCAQIESGIINAVWEIARGDRALEVLQLPPEVKTDSINVSLKDVRL